MSHPEEVIIEFQSLISLARLSEEKSGPAVCQTYSTKELVDDSDSEFCEHPCIINIVSKDNSIFFIF